MLGTKIRPPKLSGKYNIVKRRNGKVLQDVTFYNTFTRSFLNSSCITNRVPGHASNVNLFSYCIVGSGSTVPSSTDTRITTPLWVISINSYSKQGTSQDKLSRTWRYVYVIPASSQYVGVIREIGLTNSTSTTGTIFTHALVKDSEGTPIDINKTELDEVTITVDITLTRPSWRTGQTWSFWGQFNANIFRTILSTFFTVNSNGRDSRPAGGITDCWYPEGCPGHVGTLSTQLSANISDNQVSFNIECNSTCLQAGFLATLNTPFRAYVNSLYLGCIVNNSSGGINDKYGFIPAYRVLMPNTTVFPVTTLEGLSLGTGDGTTTDFAPELPAWLANTENVYKNGTLLTRGVDYLVDNLANLGGFTSVSIGNFVCDISGAEVASPTANAISIFGTGSTFNGRGGNIQGDTDSMAAIGLALKKDTPIILTYNSAAAFTDKFNRYRLGIWIGFNSSGSTVNIPAGTNIVFYYSTDNGSTWTELDRIVATSNSGTISNQNDLRTLPAAIDGLTNIKIELESDTYNDYACVTINGYGFIGYVGEYAIRFLTPPAAGDILTMDLDIDRPWKSPDTIIQWNPILSFNL